MSIRFLVREIPSVVAVGSAGERVGRARKVFREPLTELRASGSIGLRWQAGFRCQIIWNRSILRAGARGGARVGRPRWLRILSITGGSSMAAMIFKAPPQFGSVRCRCRRLI